MNDSQRTRKDRLYRLLPEIFRSRDIQNGQALQALMAVFEEQLDAIEDDIGVLYDDQFIETCAEAIVPYIGDLVGANIADHAGRLSTMRAFVGNLVGYRRRKGLPGVLAQVAHDVTGWGIRTASAASTLAGTQALNVALSSTGGTLNIRNTITLGTLDSPSDMSSRTAEIRNPRVGRPVGMQRGRYAANAFGIFVYRLAGYPVALATPVPGPTTARRGAFWFHPLGIDAPLFDWVLSPRLGEDDGQAERFSVPRPLTRAALEVWLELSPKTLPFRILYLAPKESDKPAQVQAIEAKQMRAWDLSTWNRRGVQPDVVAIDPELGRFMFDDKQMPGGEIRVSWTYGFSADIGGGPYVRKQAGGESNRLFLVGPYAKKMVDGAETTHPSLSDAIAAWKRWASDKDNKDAAAIIRIVDSRTYTWGANPNDALQIDLDTHTLTIEAENGQRPCVLGNVSVTGKEKARIRFDGLLWAGRLAASGPFQLRIEDSTILPFVPADPSFTAPAVRQASTSNLLDVHIERSIVGTIRMSRIATSLRISDSIIDTADYSPANGTAKATNEAQDQPMTLKIGFTDGAMALCGLGKELANRAAGPSAFERTTVLGQVRVAALRAEDTLFTQSVEAHSVEGFTRHCYVRKESTVPQMSHCVQVDVGPTFTSLRYGDPAYGQLDNDTPQAILTGASNGSEIGAFQHLNAAQRMKNLASALDAYVPLTLDARIFYVT